MTFDNGLRVGCRCTATVGNRTAKLDSGRNPGR
jgi:hypothetical protein